MIASELVLAGGASRREPRSLRGLGRQIAGAAVADLRERARRRSFVAMVVATLGFGWLGFSGHVEMGLGGVRSTYDSAWLGTTMALATSFFVTMVGFYFAKGTIAFDRRSGVGEVLAATPMASPTYLVSKWLANAALFATTIVILAAATALLQWQRGEAALELWPLLWPSLILAVPAALMVSALAVLFETVPLLRGGFGNVFWFFLWSLGAALILAGGGVWDWLGMGVVRRDLIAAYVATTGSEPGQFTFNIGGGDLSQGSVGFQWPGLGSDLAVVGPRIAIAVVALLLVLSSSWWFDRFVASTATARKRGRRRPDAAASQWHSPTAEIAALGRFTRRFRFGALVWAETTLAFKGVSIPLRLVMAVPAVMAAFAGEAADGFAVAAALLPVLIWSQLGARERSHGTDQILFSTPRPVGRLLLASWIAGVLVGIAALGPWIVGLAAAGDLARAAAVVAGLGLAPALALACGTWSGGSRLFEGLYVVLWYVGPANQTPALDWIGAGGGAAASTPMVLLTTAVLLGLAVFGRVRQLRR